VRVSPLLAGALGGLAAMLLLAPATGDALGRLAKARQQRAALAAQAAAPAIETGLVAPGLAWRAPTGGEAAARLLAGVRGAAGRAGVLVEEARVLSAPGGLVRVQLRASGSEEAVLSLAEALERQRPLVRFARWRLAALPSGGVRLDGEVVAPWG
jgi:hypothetical protein